MSKRRMRNGRPALAAAVLAALLANAPHAAAQDLLPSWDDDDGLDIVSELEDEIRGEARDFDRLRLSHLSEVHLWQGVRPARPRKGEESDPDCGWKVVRAETVPPRAFVSPIAGHAASTTIAVPEDGAYRVWLSYVAERDKPHAVTLTLSGATSLTHEYGRRPLTSAPGSAQEQTLPIRFEDELQRESVPTGPTVVWEFADLKLSAGKTLFALTSADREAEVDAVFITASRAFRPSKSHLPGEGNLYRTWFRVRVTAGAGASGCTVKSSYLGYHWRRILRGSTEPMWYWQLGTQDEQGFRAEEGGRVIAAGEWSRWVEATEDVCDGPWGRGGGPWATGRLTFDGVHTGTAELQMAWFPHEAAVLRSVRPGIAGNAAVFMVPLDNLPTGPVSGTNTLEGVWGMRKPEVVSRFESASDVHARHFEWGRGAIAELGLADDHPMPRKIVLTTGCNPAPAARETAQRMLAALGLNDVGVSDPELLAELGHERHVFIAANDSQYLCNSHNPLDPAAEANFEQSLRRRAESIHGLESDNPPLVTLKMGDEIGAVAGPDKINLLPRCRAAFHDYLRAELAHAGNGPDYLGVERVEELRYSDGLPPLPGIHERRLHYHCSRFKFLLTCMYYAQLTRAAERVFPRVLTYCNFSPHPPMFGQNMNHSDWFVLTRSGGANMAWGEGWASGGGWGFVGYEVVSYYAAWVQCAARTHNNPAGFYIVGTMGGADRKLFSVVTRGIFRPLLYSWGPMYSIAEGSNAWSERRQTYYEIARGACALGPVDEIVHDGAREPARAALLYNRSHEIWNGAYGGYQSDRLLTFMALLHAHIPVDIILEDELAPEALERYDALYLQGLNLEPARLAAVQRWVEDGGTVVGVAGTGMRDQYDDAAGQAEQLFGARQRLAGCSAGSWHPQSLPKHEPIDRLTLQASELTPSLSVDVIGVKSVLTPTAGTSVGTFADGSCGAVVNRLGKGRALLLGVMPGLIYKGKTEGSSRYTTELRELVTLPAERALGERRVQYSEAQTETCLFEHEDGLAVTLINFAWFMEPRERTALLRVRTDRPVREVSSSLRGPLSWKRAGDWVEVDVPAPETVDAVILR